MICISVKSGVSFTIAQNGHNIMYELRSVVFTTSLKWLTVKKKGFGYVTHNSIKDM